MSDLGDRLKAKGVKKIKTPAKRTEPLWEGPSEEGKNGGITFSLLSRFLVCRERFRLHVVEGLRPAEDFNHRIEYGNFWHVCEEALAGFNNDGKYVPSGDGKNDVWNPALNVYASTLAKKYPLQAEQVDHWYRVCKCQFPLYVKWWSEHPDVLARTPLLQEQVFDVPYMLPSGRAVRLRGKWDSVDVIGKGKSAGVYLQENKTKGDVNPIQMKRQLSWDLQTMLYLVALGGYQRHTGFYGSRNTGPSPAKDFCDNPILGVRYNVVRRPLSGGRGSIVRHKGSKNVLAETKDAYYSRLGSIIEGAEGPEWDCEPGVHHFFMRWKCEISPGDVAKFRRECLDPILENLCDWWAWIQSPQSFVDNLWPTKANHGLHWRHPFGVYNILDEGGSSDLDEYLHSGSEAGLTRVDTLFRELE